MNNPITKQELVDLLDKMISRDGVTDVDFSLNTVLKSMVGVMPYKVYTALLTQSGTNAPTPTILQNNIGNISWTRNGSGDYKGTLSGAFPANKTFLLSGASSSTFENLILFWVDANTIELLTSGSDNFDNVSIRIEVYP